MINDEYLDEVISLVTMILSDSEVKKYKLEAKVLATALIMIKERPKTSIIEVLKASLEKWDV